MILFVGSEEKGHFIREVAKSYQWNAAFVHPKLDIFSQVQEILQYPDCKVMRLNLSLPTSKKLCCRRRKMHSMQIRRGLLYRQKSEM